MKLKPKSDDLVKLYEIYCNWRAVPNSIETQKEIAKIISSRIWVQGGPVSVDDVTERCYKGNLYHAVDSYIGKARRVINELSGVEKTVLKMLLAAKNGEVSREECSERLCIMLEDVPNGAIEFEVSEAARKVLGHGLYASKY
jgi:hypothetical protein